ncbi:putative formate transporter 1 [Oxobacter pfennigii]|uniref:Putative formate transporter 1 n=1 Tax=Oxobacter pfennigii TaxID=36849 RepID=A0A0P8WYB8_9CLOT|nr:putative formate transporter 1 [Oxobacter pfennigii]
MRNDLFYTPQEITKNYVESGHKRATLSSKKLILLGILAGAFIAFAAEGSNQAIHTIESVGIGKALAGALFSTGLMMVIMAGGELFTGNCLIIISCAEGRTRWRDMAKNLFFVYIGNFIGSVLIAYLIFKSGQLGFSGGLLGGYTIKTATYKTGLTFTNAFILGILCNWLVCIAVWMASAAKDITGKVFAIFFPIWLFITSGFEHSIANMYYIPAGIMAKSNPAFVEQAIKLGVSPEKIAALNWGTFITKNLIPVTLGNIVGGAVCVGLAYWFIYSHKSVNLVEENSPNNTLLKETA